MGPDDALRMGGGEGHGPALLAHGCVDIGVDLLAAETVGELGVTQDREREPALEEGAPAPCAGRFRAGRRR